MDKISRGVWPTHDTKTSMSPTVSSERTCRLPACHTLFHSLPTWMPSCHIPS